MDEGQAKFRAEWYKYRSLLYDQATGLPTLPAIMFEIRKLLEEEKVIGLLYLSVGEELRIEPVFGWELYDDLIKSFTISILGQVGKIIPTGALIAISSIRGDGFFIFLSHNIVGGKITKEYLQMLAQKFEEIAGRIKTNQNYKEMRDKIHFFSGYEIIRIDPMVRNERLIYQSAEDVKYTAYFKERLRERDLYSLLERIIHNKLIRTVYQPIYDLEENRIFGYEALTRGPEGSYFEDPDTIFSFAARVNLLKSIEEICLQAAIKGARLIPQGTKLFLNINPSLVTTLISDEFIDNIKATGLEIEKVVFEMTERLAIPDYEVYRGVFAKLKARGFEISIDDVGTGYSTLERIAETRPDYLKYDRTLVKGINYDLIRQELIKSIRDFAKRIKATIIVEGIENKGELEFVKNIGIRYGQGFFLALPQVLK